MVPMGFDLVKRRLKGWVTVRYSGCNGEEDTLIPRTNFLLKF